MIVSACAAREPSGSSFIARRMAARTSGGRSVDVLMMSERTESKKPGTISKVYRRDGAHLRAAAKQSRAANRRKNNAPRFSTADLDPCFLVDGRHHARSRHWGQRVDFQRGEWRPAQAAPLREPGDAGWRVARSPRNHA